MTKKDQIITCKKYLEDLDKNHDSNEYKLLMQLLEEPQKDCISRDTVLLKIADLPKYHSCNTKRSIRKLNEFFEKEFEEPIEVTPDMGMGFTLALEYLRDFIMDLPLITSTQDWILLNEKLPEKNGWCLVTFKNPYGSNFVQMMFYKEDHWSNGPLSKDTFNNDNFLAWMPLPDVYKSLPF